MNNARTSATMVAAQWKKGRKRQRETKLSTTPRIMSTADAWRFSLTVGVDVCVCVCGCVCVGGWVWVGVDVWVCVLCTCNDYIIEINSSEESKL